jgi:hypothetical protein
MNTIHTQPYPHFLELIQFLESDISPIAEYPIHLKNSMSNENQILFMTEQLTSNDTNFYYNQLSQNFIKEIWTFSSYNVEMLKKHNILKAKYIKMDVWDEYRTKLLSYNPDNTYDYDVCVVGWMSARREEIVNQLVSKGVKVKVIGYNNTLFGDERDKVIRKSKILLNIHYSDEFFCFEQIRCFPFISVGHVVVSETSHDVVDSVIFADYDKLSDKVIEVLKNFD